MAMYFAPSPIPETEPPRDCPRCPRLVAFREALRVEYPDWWNAPVNAFGDPDAWLTIVGLAPGKHGANRTGRMFTGDQSGDVLYRALYDVGLANKPTAVSIDDGLELTGVRITAPVHCAPPQNKPTPAERDQCAHWLHNEIDLLAPTLRSVFVLGAFGWQAALTGFAGLGWEVSRPRPKFGHGAQTVIRRGDRELTLFASYHVSQHNTFTGRLTPAMLREVLRGAGRHAGLPVVDDAGA